MKLSPRLQLTLFSVLGALFAAMVDVGVNGAASGVAKASAWFGLNGLGVVAAGTFAWGGHVVLGLLAAAYFQPLTRRSAGSLAFGLAAIASILIPGAA